MKFRRCLISALWLAVLYTICLGHNHVDAGSPQLIAEASDVTFLVKPYLQIGDAPPGSAIKDLVLLWHVDDVESVWRVEYQLEADATTHVAAPPTWRRIAVPGIAPHRLFRGILKGLPSGRRFAYRVRQGEDVVFTAEARAPKTPGKSFRFVSFGDCGAGTAQQKAIAYQTYLAHPDFLMITGDIVYGRGRISEYREKFWPVYNADEASPLVGAPLLRSILFVAAPGNHDIASRDLAKYPDCLAYFLYWEQPRNGPFGAEGGPLVPPLIGPAANREAFIAASGRNYPRMANFSFDYGNSHWTVLDSNPYVDWNNPELRAWVERDLSGAKGNTWRFVAFHHPGFNSSKAHLNDQQMRLLAGLFESGRVDIVFSGHVHNYQRSFPLRFVANKGKDGKLSRDQNKVPGRWTLDKVFDGQTNTRPDGVIYLVTGAGGNKLYNPEQQDDPGSWQSFTHRFISRVHTLTVADINGTTLTVRQLSAEGHELDRFSITK